MDGFADVQAVAFLAAAAVTLRAWWQQRSRPAAFVALAFVGLAAVTVPGASFLPEVALPSAAAVVILALFPWLLAAFAWSFAGALPRWLWAAGVVLAALGGWGAWLARTGEVADSVTFVVLFLAAWTVLSAATALRLVRSGGRFPLVRSRMRTLAVGVVLLNAALLLAGVGTEASPVLEVVLSLLVIGSAGLFLLGFAPPPLLRLWWRRRATAEFDRMQAELIAARTVDEVADAAVPRIAAMLGTGVAMFDREGRPLRAVAGTGEDRSVVADEPRPGDRRVEVADARLVVRRTPYRPVFGTDEEQLLGVLARQVSMAIERAALHEATERARAELEATLLGLSHDLRNPAVAIHGFAQLLAEDPPDRLEMVAHIRDSAGYLHRLVEAMLEVASVGRTGGVREPVDVGEVAREVASRASATHPAAHVEVVGDAAPVHAERLRVVQLLENLVGNALKHGGRDDLTVRVELEDAPGRLRLTVRDDGVGIPADERERAFALFHRGRAAGASGNGLGLGMVRRITESLDGSVVLEPSEVGARFAVTLPTTTSGGIAAPDGAAAPTVSGG